MSTTRERERVIPTTPLEDRSLGELLATLSRDVALLVHQELELAKAQAKAAALRAGVGVGALVAALVLILLAAPMWSTAFAFGIHSLGVSLGWSFFIIGGGYVALGLPLIGLAVGQLKKAKPPSNPVASVKADLHAVAHKPNSGRASE
jgi:Putative Actinobacterial Holin-X, holin superfamily III